MKTDKRSKKSLGKNETSSNHQKKQIYCTIRVGENFNKKINKHIDTLKKCQEGRYSRNQWINDAIKAKLEKEIQGNTISVDKHLNARIDVKLLELINQQVKVMKKFNHSYSKQKWIIEALSEKLEEEELSSKKRLNDLITASKKEVRTKR